MLTEMVSDFADFIPSKTAFLKKFQRARQGVVYSFSSVFMRMASSSNESNSPAIKKMMLSTEEYNVARQGGTEPAFTGKFDKHFKAGKYTCLCCGADLFVSESKYNSGCGWPAFSKSIESDKNIVRIHDTSYGMERTEVRCRQCNAHLGHVFDDGPKETGERYCINSISLNFNEAGDQKL
uniref:Peptide-methionine (R)-S-oxide reductase n=1 Tax=Ditylenchus dipsaci TaxID=166011 RepID=A0A915E6T6_9BILA